MQPRVSSSGGKEASPSPPHPKKVVFKDDKMSSFYSFFREHLQRKLHDRSLTRAQKYEVNICSNILGNSFEEQLSTAQASFRRDLKLVLEVAGVKDVKLVLLDDSRL